VAIISIKNEEESINVGAKQYDGHTSLLLYSPRRYTVLSVAAMGESELDKIFLTAARGIFSTNEYLWATGFEHESKIKQYKHPIGMMFAILSAARADCLYLAWENASYAKGTHSDNFKNSLKRTLRLVISLCASNDCAPGLCESFDVNEAESYIEKNTPLDEWFAVGNLLDSFQLFPLADSHRIASMNDIPYGYEFMNSGFIGKIQRSKNFFLETALYAIHIVASETHRAQSIEWIPAWIARHDAQKSEYLGLALGALTRAGAIHQEESEKLILNMFTEKKKQKDDEERYKHNIFGRGYTWGLLWSNNRTLSLLPQKSSNWERLITIMLYPGDRIAPLPQSLKIGVFLRKSLPENFSYLLLPQVMDAFAFIAASEGTIAKNSDEGVNEIVANNIFSTMLQNPGWIPAAQISPFLSIAALDFVYQHLNSVNKETFLNLLKGETCQASLSKIWKDAILWATEPYASEEVLETALFNWLRERYTMYREMQFDGNACLFPAVFSVKPSAPSRDDCPYTQIDAIKKLME